MDGAELGIRLILMFAFGAITAAIASSKGRNVAGWFFVGFFLSCIGLILILCLSNLKEEQAKWDRAEREQHRLREQLKQERLKNEAFQGHVRARLEVHDGALDMDTRQLAGARAAETSAELAAPMDCVPPPLETGAAKEAVLRFQQWHVNIESHKGRPVSFDVLRSLYSSKRIDENTLVWTSGMTEWKRIVQVAGLIEELIT